MKRCFHIALLLLGFLASGVSLRAQNNPYDLDDECYESFIRLRGAVGTADYDRIRDEHMALCMRKKDYKAEVIGYTMDLENASQLKDDKLMLKAVEETKSIARQYGFPQYYYHAYSRMMSYYFNKNGAYSAQAIEVLREMNRKAVEEKSDYGLWLSQRMLGEAYVATGDLSAAKSYFMEAVRIYDKTRDPVLLRQSESRVFSSLGECYLTSLDSASYYMQIAIEKAKVQDDTLRVWNRQMPLLLSNGDVASFRKLGSVALRNTVFVRRFPAMVSIDSIVTMVEKNQIDRAKAVLGRASLSSFELFCLSSYAEKMAGPEFNSAVLGKLVRNQVTAQESANRMKLVEADADMGNEVLRSDLLDQTVRSHGLMRGLLAVSIMLAVVLASFLIYMVIHSRKDIKRQRKMIETLQGANERVVKADRAKTAFVQNVSHEIRTPLNAIVGFSQLLGMPEGMVDDNERKEYAKYVLDNSSMLTMLVDDILNASDIENGNYNIVIEKASCNEICRSAMKTVEYRIPQGVGFRLESALDDDYCIKTDPRRVQQILINLLANATKNTVEGEIVLGVSRNAGAVEFSVTDTGVGVPPEKAQDIFERFVKLDSFKQGTGLGLNICKSLGDKLGGRICLDTTYTSGARFVLSLPDENF